MKKPLKAYAVVDSDGNIDCWNHQVPVFWRRHIALRECKNRSFSDSKVITVLITEKKK